jgi:hypothetical protein
MEEHRWLPHNTPPLQIPVFGADSNWTKVSCFLKAPDKLL